MITQVIDNRAKVVKPTTIKEEKRTSGEYNQGTRSRAGQPKPSTSGTAASCPTIRYGSYDDWVVDLDLADELAEGLTDD